ncbi:GNAT family N-acetyltransferase [Aestuariispira insulae]|uniref:Phosphinothricin acetyltransferase n=1 Tax=Aestuariispira insulae TaxID=1461337 RepID=A0A3D9HSF8_9PROT|nr:GNAT family N-acetyltransferase [Aestuariispira insulae]RED52355.1 phosphinothricin acetyltransferase [Aestuariispira insulae]
MTQDITIRPAHSDDLPAITEIYGHHVRHGLASFEETAPDLAEMTARFTTLANLNYPYLTALKGERVLGYAYAGPYRTRPAYRFTVENSVYVAPDATGLGAGGALLDALIAACEEGGFRQMIAVIGDSGNAASIGLHGSRGFEHAGVLAHVGFKHGRWVDSVFMQRTLGPGGNSLPTD